MLTLISHSHTDFCQIFAIVLHVVAFGQSFPHTFALFVNCCCFVIVRAPELLLSLMFLLFLTLALTHTRIHSQDRTQREKLRVLLYSLMRHENKNIIAILFCLLIYYNSNINICIFREILEMCIKTAFDSFRFVLTTTTRRVHRTNEMENKAVVAAAALLLLLLLVLLLLCRLCGIMTFTAAVPLACRDAASQLSLPLPLLIIG